jgi:Secretory lipase
VRAAAVALLAVASLAALPVRAAATAEPNLNLSCTSSAKAVSPTPPPEDPFYTPPNALPSGRPGKVIRSRPVCIGDLQVPVPYRAWDVMYLSTGAEDARGRPSELHAVPSVDTALIVEPLTGGSHPLVAWAVAEDADSTLKAPSYTMAQGNSWDNAAWQWALGHGWVVVVPDYEGPDSAYSPGPLEGHGMLDGIRAAENFSATDGLDYRKTQVGLWGYSGGAMATAWASELAPSYAPELRIAGVAEGGVPADVHNVFDTINGGYLAPGLAFASALGDNAAYPNLVPLSLLNKAGLELAAHMRATGDSSYPTTYPPQNISMYTACACNPADLPNEFPGVAEVARTVNPGQHIPRAPLFIYHDYNDELIPIDGVERLVQYYCDGGATVAFRVNSGDEHVSNAIVGAPEALTYLTGRFNGLRPANTCGLPDNGGVIPPSPIPVVPLPPPLP